MDITYLGHSSFKIKGKTASVITDPYDEKIIGLKYPKIEADIVTVSHHHGDHDKVENVTPATDKKIKVIDGPGEYEVQGISIIGISSFHDNKNGEERGKNTMYVIEVDGLRLLHLGDLGHKLEDKEIKEISNIDILFLPVGGYYTIDPKQAIEVYKQIGASVIIPMHFRPSGIENDVLDRLVTIEDFTKEANLRVENLPKLTLKEGDLTSDEEYICLLEKK